MKNRKTKLLCLIMTVIMVISLLPATVLATDPESIQIGIYSTTDMHGKVYDQNPVGGTWKDSYLKVATVMKQERSEMDGTILIDNGDLLQGSTIMSYNINIENGEYSPAALCLRYCGYDAFVPGNHEFNFTLDVQNKFYSLLTSTDESLPGTPVSVVCANLLDTETEKVADPYTPYIIREFTVGEKTFRIGVLGFENMNVPNWDLPSHYEGMRFGHADNEDQSYAYEWTNYWQKILREDEKCDIVIVSCHSGEGSADTYNKESQVAHFIANTTGIDMVIAGHNHQRGTSVLKNADGQNVPCVNGGTTTLTKTVITLNSDGTFSFGDSSLIALNSTEIANNSELKKLIQPAYEKAATFVNEPIGTLSGEWDEVNTYLTVQGDSYDLVHKAQIWATGADVSITTPVPKRNINGVDGSFRLSSLFAEGKETATVSLKDCYNLYQYDNNLLYGIKMTGAQLKAWLEKCATTYRVSSDGKISGGGYGTDIAYGINYDVYLGEPEGQRVRNVTLADGTAVTDDMVLKVALSSYRLSAGEGNDAYGWWATTGITSTSDAVYYDASTSPEFGAVGGSVPLIVGEYIKAMCKDGASITPGSATHWKLHASTDPEEPVEIMVMSTTDMHGKVWSTDVLTDSQVRNSFLKVATAVDDARDEYGSNTILIDNGDLYQGTTVSTYNILSQNGENNPMVTALRYIGYDAAVLGNHEFNYPWETMQGMYADLSAAADDNGTSVPVLAANLYWRDGEHEGENAFTPYTIKTFDVNGQTFKVGIIGFENTDCDQFDVPANFGVNSDGTGGVTLTPPGNETRDMAVEAAKYVETLREDEGCDFVIVSYHSGLGRGNETGDLTIGTNTESQVSRMIANNTGIDLVIAGHDHQVYRDTTVKDASGKDITVINGGGSSLARAVISVSYDEKSGFSVEVTNPGNLSLNNLANDAGLAALIKPAADAATAYVNSEFGTAIGEWDQSPDYRMGHNDTIDLINRAQIWTAQQNGVQMDVAATTDIVSNRYVVTPGTISLKDIYRMYKYDNYLYAVEMTGEQMKAWLEGVAAFYSADTSGDEIQFSVQRNFVTALFYGLEFQYDLSREVGDRVINLKLASTGKAIQPTDTLIVGVNNYVIGQDPFVKAMGKDASKTEDKAEIIANAVWSSQESLGDEQGLVTQMVANYIKSETESAGGVSAVPSNWSLTYTVTSDEPVSMYSITVDTAGNGAVAADCKTAYAGVTVTITVTPDEGYVLDTLKVLDQNGKEVALTEKTGKYTFSMPASRVIVKAVFKAAASAQTGFTDVPADSYYADAVAWAVENGITTGTSDTLFSPNAACTRAQAVTFLWRAAGSPVVDYTVRFTDVPTDAYYADAVRWAASLGITTGTTDTTFSPDDTCTRAQIVSFIYRSEKAQGGGFTGDWMGLLPFADAPDWAYESIAWCYQEGITTGTSADSFSPDDDCTRAQIVTFLYRSSMV